MALIWVVFKLFSVLALIDFCFLLVVAVCRANKKGDDDEQ